MIPVKKKEEGLCGEEKGKDQRKGHERMIHGTENQTRHTRRSDIIKGQDRCFPGRMGFESVGPSRREKKEDGKNKIDPREHGLESLNVPQKG